MEHLVSIKAVLCYRDALALITFKPGGICRHDCEKTVVLNQHQMKNLLDKIDEVKEKVEKMKNNSLDQTYKAYIGRYMFIVADPWFKTVSIRKYEKLTDGSLQGTVPAYTFDIVDFNEFCARLARMKDHLKLEQFIRGCCPSLPCNSAVCLDCKI